jgi:hypothetical protein
MVVLQPFEILGARDIPNLPLFAKRHKSRGMGPGGWEA